MASAYQEYHVQLINKRTGSPIDDDTGVCNVLTAGDPAEITIYSDDQGTSASNPLTITDGEISFFTASGTQTVDITGMTADGIPFFIESLTPSQHRLEIDTEQYTGMQLIIPFNINASTSLFDTGFDFTAKHIIKDVKVRVTTAGGSVTANILQIGISGTPTILCGTCQVSVTGFLQHVPGLTAQPAATGSVSMQVGIGLLASSTNTYWREVYEPAAATSIIYREHAATGITGQGYIYIDLDREVV
jgi:hypothetical protein